MIKILFVCHGNICRSPMAEFVMKDMVRKAGFGDKIFVASAATSTEEIGNDIHYGTRTKLIEEGIPFSPRSAVQLKKRDYNEYDFIIGMDSQNIRNIKRIVGNDIDGKVKKLLEYANCDRDIADPWYTGNFEATYSDVVEGCEALLKIISDELQ